MSKKMQTKCIFIASNFVNHPRILIFSVFKIASCSPYWLQIKFSMSLFFYLFTFAINLWHRKFVKADVMQCLSTISMVFRDKDKILIKAHKYTQNTVIRIDELKSVYIKCNLFAFSSIPAEYMQKFKFLISRGSVATCLRWGWLCCMSFIANFIRFLALQKFWKSVKIWQSYKELKGENFFETQYIYNYRMSNSMHIVSQYLLSICSMFSR